ncbi:NADPH-dependent F420 reductase [Pontibacter sp. G13]|uniref:NADPH-dependent F420 reductase n=1 Tax=Pontibacter sp. G13 TaxID=3074898 RepID=UPI00288A4CC6|nr:NADPH-dependent F420 reductase [Pontibacter sp. G13]WNJ19258.1 NADPH-dependent F420 reductase [Pontibacter sp. G13]
MKVGILGTGTLASALATAFTKRSVSVMFGSRSRDRALEAARTFPRFASGGDISSTIHFAEVVFLAVPYQGLNRVLEDPDAFRGKVVVDCTNPVLPDDRFQLAFGHSTSGAEQISAMIPQAHLVKAFNTAFARHVADGPYFGPNDGSMFYCGDHSPAKDAVHRLIETAGFEPVDCGPLHKARLLEPMAVLLDTLKLEMDMGDDIALKILKRGE